MVLRESLLTILQTKPISRISVTEVCQAAGLNRGTFYAHYADPYELLTQIESDLYRELEDALAKDIAREDIDVLLSNIMGVLSRNRDMCRVILGENGGAQFLSKILGMAREFFVHAWACKKGVPEGTADFIYRYLSAGSVDVIRYWLLNGDARAQDEVTHIISGICKSIISAYMEPTQPNKNAREEK
jgi:AcrR family transcriptional regulator